MNKKTSDSGFKEYKNVQEFPLRVDQLSRDEIVALYSEMRQEYKKLSISRGQLVRRRIEGKQNVLDLKRTLALVSSDVEAIEQERDKFQRSLQHSINVQGKMQTERDALSEHIQSLRQKLNATQSLISDFEVVYESVVTEERSLSGFFRLLQAAKRLLTTDLKELTMKRAEPEPIEEFLREDPASINRRLLDD
jgi:chromosome segregation ATPase